MGNFSEMGNAGIKPDVNQQREVASPAETAGSHSVFRMSHEAVSLEKAPKEIKDKSKDIAQTAETKLLTAQNATVEVHAKINKSEGNEVEKVKDLGSRMLFNAPVLEKVEEAETSIPETPVAKTEDRPFPEIVESEVKKPEEAIPELKMTPPEAEVKKSEEKPVADTSKIQRKMEETQEKHQDLLKHIETVNSDSFPTRENYEKYLIEKEGMHPFTAPLVVDAEVIMKSIPKSR